jgi:hypothetical protein
MKLICVLISIFIGSLSNYPEAVVFKLNFNYSREEVTNEQFVATSEFLDAAINSINSFNSLIKKENYRIKIISFNNPTSSDMGFNLENEIQTALKPLLAKPKAPIQQNFPR